MKIDRWQLTGKKALVTGGTRGIGRAIVEELLGLGAEVFVVARNEKHVHEMIASYQNSGHLIHGMAIDLGQSETVSSKVIEEVVRVFGGLDILINNVGTNIRKNAEAYSMPAASYITGQCIAVDGGFLVNGFANHANYVSK